MRMVLYSVTAFVVLFLVDRVAGGFFAIVSALLIAALLGYISARTQVIASEVALALGMFASAFIGPSGGLLSPLFADRHADPVLLGQGDSPARDGLD